MDWEKLMKVDPDVLPSQEKLVDNLLDSISKIEIKDIQDGKPENLFQLFKITQALMKMKAQEVELAYEEVEKAGEEQAKTESQLKNKIRKLENELEMAQLSTGGRDTRFLRDEIRQLEKQLEQKDKELTEMEKELEKEKKVNEQLALRNEEAENENSKLRRENEQLRQDIIDYQRQIDSQRETLLSRRGGDADYRSQLSKKNLELVQYLDEIQNLTEANEKLEVQNQEMTKNLEESVQEMEKMTDEYSKMKLLLQQSDTVIDQLRKEKEQYRLQVQELTAQLQARNEEDDPVMIAVNTKVEEWKRILASKDDEIIEYQQMLHNLKEKLKNTQLDGDKSNIMALQQGLQERDSQVKMLTEQVDQYTKEMEKHSQIIEDLNCQLQKDKGVSTLAQQNRVAELHATLQLQEQRTKEFERVAELAEGDAREKDKELVEAMRRMREYEMGIYGLEEAVAEIKDLKMHIKIRDHEIEELTKEINQLELKISDFLDENEELRERLGLDPRTMIDLREFKTSKALKQQQYRAENQVLVKEIERLEEERVELKQQIRKLAQEKGKRAVALGLTADDLQLIDDFTEDLKTKKSKIDFMSPANISELKEKVIRTCKMESPVRRSELDDRKSEQNKFVRKMAVKKVSRRCPEILDNSLEEPDNNKKMPRIQLDSTQAASITEEHTSESLETNYVKEIFKSKELQAIEAMDGLRAEVRADPVSLPVKHMKNTYVKTQRTSGEHFMICGSSKELEIALPNENGETPQTNKYESSLNLDPTVLLNRVLPQSVLLQESQEVKLESPENYFQISDSVKERNQLLCFHESISSAHHTSQKSEGYNIISEDNMQSNARKDICSQEFDSRTLVRTENNEILLPEMLYAQTLDRWHESESPFIKPCTSETKQLQLNQVESHIEQLRIELASLRSENEYLSKELNGKEREVEQNRTRIAEFKSKLNELTEENKQLEQGMKEILQAIKEAQVDSNVKGGETTLVIPSLERLVSAIESKTANGIFDASVHLKAQADQLTGRNEELRQELKGSRKEATNLSNQLAKANEKIAHLENEISLLRQSEGANIIFRAINLPEGMTVSSTNIINSLNEYLIHLIQELENKEQSIQKLEEAIEEYKRKSAVIRHQQGLLYKEYQSERESWQIDTEKMKEEKKKLEDQKEQDAVRIKEYTRLLETLNLDPDEVKKLLAESSRKITVLRVNEKSLTRRYTTLLEMEQHLRKENGKLKTDLMEMEVAVAERIGYLQRCKEMLAFKIAASQKALEDSVPLTDLEWANKQYNELTAKYRDMLQKDNLLVQRTTRLEHLEHENASLREQIDASNKELEITKEKLHTLEQAWEHISKQESSAGMDKATKAITNNEIVSISKKITMLEMKELNERQRAEHAQKMYDHLRITLKEVEERNLELENKFAELTKINLEAQKMEELLRDELASSVSKAVSDADRRRIMELEESESELKIEISKLRDLSDIAKMQVITLEARQLSREKEVESLRKQVLDYQAQSDEKSLIAKLHQHIVALQLSEATAVGKLEAVTAKLQKMETCSLRLEQKLDAKEQALYYARLEGRNRAKHLRHTIQSLRRQFSGALPLAQQEKFSKTMIQLQNDKLKIMQDMQRTQQERQDMENYSLEVELKLKSLEELLATLKDARGAHKVTEWHKRMEELRLQDLKLNRELVKGKEEIKYLNNIISEHERTIMGLEEEIVQQSKFHEERQMAWDQREVELERQLDMYEHQQQEVLSTAQKFEEATGSVPDSSLPLPQQLDIALRKIKEHVRTILETRTAYKTLEEKVKEKEAVLWKTEQNVLARDKIINELRLRLPTTSEQEKLLGELSQKEDDPVYQKSLKVAQQTIANMQARLNQKEGILKKYQQHLEKSREEQVAIAKNHEENLRVLYQKLDVHADVSLNKFKQTVLDLMKKPSLTVPTNKDLMRLAEMEQTVAEQDNSIVSLSGKLKRLTEELERQKQITLIKMKEFENTKARLEESHAVEVKALKNKADELRSQLSQMEKELHYLNTELEGQKEANTRAPTSTMKNLMERLKSQLALKEKQQKALSKALLTLREEMTAHAEEQIIAAAAQKEENLNVQQIVDRQTKNLKVRIDDLNEQITKLKDAHKANKLRESTMAEKMETLNQELEDKQKALSKLQRVKEEVDRENEELKKKVKRLISGLQSKLSPDNKQSLIDELQKKVRRLESELEKKVDEIERKTAREDKSSKEEIIKWEEGKKWQTRVEGIRNKLKEKEKEVETLTKQLSTLKELYSRMDQEKFALQKKLKTRAVTADQVVGVRNTESEKEVEELRKKNNELENEISHVRTKQALPRDSVIEDLHLKNQYLQEKLQVLERQFSKDTFSRPSTSGLGSDHKSQREQGLQKENLRLSSENIELHFQLEQTKKDLPRLKDQVAGLKEMCELLKKDKMEVERKLGNIRGSGRSGKTVAELEKTIALMKKVVERVQRENDELKKAPGVVSNEKLSNLETENEKLKLDMEKLKHHVGSQLSMRYETKAKGTEKIVAENERLRKDLKKETETNEKLRITKSNLELTNEKLTLQLEELEKRLSLAESRGSQAGVDSHDWKSRMYDDKIKEMGTDLTRKNENIADLKQLLREAAEREKKMEQDIQELKNQVELFKCFPEDAKTEESLARELQLVRLTNNRLEKEKVELVHQMEEYRCQIGVSTSGIPTAGYDELLEKGRKHDKLMAEVVDLQIQVRTSNLEKESLKEEIKKMKKELDHFDPSFFEEIEDLKYNYNEEVKRNIILEEKLKNLSEQFGIQVDIPVNVSTD